MPGKSSSTKEEEFTLEQLRTSLHAIHYKLRTKRSADFISATILDATNTPINTGNIFCQEFLDTHEKAINIIKTFRGKTFNGLWRVIL